MEFILEKRFEKQNLWFSNAKNHETNERNVWSYVYSIAWFFKCLIVKSISFDFLRYLIEQYLKYVLAKVHTFIQFVQLLNIIFHTRRRDQMMVTQFGNPRRKKIVVTTHILLISYFCYNWYYIKLLDRYHLTALQISHHTLK